MSYYRHSDLGIQSADSDFPYYTMEKQRQQTCRPTDVVPSKEQLLNYINQVSLAVYDTVLFLDTHACDQEAMEYFRKHLKLREAAMKEYSRLYGPLTVGQMNGSSYDSWEWVMQPWPWEGGSC